MMRKIGSIGDYARPAATVTVIVAAILGTFLGIQKADNQLPQETIVVGSR